MIYLLMMKKMDMPELIVSDKEYIARMSSPKYRKFVEPGVSARANDLKIAVDEYLSKGSSRQLDNLINDLRAAISYQRKRIVEVKYYDICSFIFGCTYNEYVEMYDNISEDLLRKGIKEGYDKELKKIRRQIAVLLKRGYDKKSVQVQVWASIYQVLNNCWKGYQEGEDVIAEICIKGSIVKIKRYEKCIVFLNSIKGLLKAMGTIKDSKERSYYDHVYRTFRPLYLYV